MNLTKKTGFACIFAALTISATSQDVQWLKAFHGAYDVFLYDMCVDKQGNVYSTGRCFDSTDFDPGSASQLRNSEFFISKLDGSGQYQWAFTFSAQTSSWGQGIAVDDSGNVYVTGVFGGTIDFDPGAGTSFLTAQIVDVVILKIRNDGTFGWARSFGSKYGDAAQEITFDNAGNVYVVALMGDDTVDVDPGAGTFTLDCGTFDPVVVKLDKDGNFLHGFKTGGPHPELFYPFGETDIEVDGSGNIYTSNDIGVTKFSATGTVLWTQAPGANSIRLDNNGNVFTTGPFYSNTDFDAGAGTQTIATAGGWDVYVQKIDNSGNRVWLRTFGGTGADLSYGIDVDQGGHVYVTGAFQVTADFDPGPGQYTLTSEGSFNAFLLELNAGGNFYRARRLGGEHQDFGTAVALDPGGAIHVAGYYSRVGHFGSGVAGTYTLSTVRPQYHDAFILKLNTIVGVTGIPEWQHPALYPNPAREFVMLNAGENCRVMITDATGKIIVNSGNVNGSQPFLVKDYPRGLYFVTISDGDIIARQKLLIE